MRTLLFLASVLLFTFAHATHLPRLNINPNTTTISGISAGGAMAVQFQYAYSALVKGVGIVAGVPYLCAQSLVEGALSCMSNPELIDLALLQSDVAALAATGSIDSTDNLQQQTVVMFSGLDDTVVLQGTMLLVAEMNEVYGAKQMTHFFNYSAEHAWITSQFGNACGYLGSPYLNNCGLDFGGEVLQSSFRNMGLPWFPIHSAADPSRLHTFSQAAYGASADISLDTEGFVYIPPQCANLSAQCHLHVNFHGCNQQRTLIGTSYVLNTGLNEWADANDIVILYPQTVASELIPYNPKGCFDWWGYAGPTYATQEGPQMWVVRSMIRALGGY